MLWGGKQGTWNILHLLKLFFPPKLESCMEIDSLWLMLNLDPNLAMCGRMLFGVRRESCVSMCQPCSSLDQIPVLNLNLG